MNDGTIKFLLGETRILKFRAAYPEHPDFAIDNAKYEIIHNNVKIKEGPMDVDAHDVTMSYTPDDRGFFDLYIELNIADTVRRKHFIIDVD